MRHTNLERAQLSMLIEAIYTFSIDAFDTGCQCRYDLSAPTIDRKSHKFRGLGDSATAKLLLSYNPICIIVKIDAVEVP